MGTAHYEIFSVDMNGKEETVDKGVVGFILMKKVTARAVFLSMI